MMLRYLRSLKRVGLEVKLGQDNEEAIGLQSFPQLRRMRRISDFLGLISGYRQKFLLCNIEISRNS
jgi:hypothetical protein